MSLDWYSVFGLDRNAPSEELSRKLDDRLAATNTADTRTIEQLREARATLGDPRSKASYDASLAHAPGPPSMTPPPPGTGTGTGTSTASKLPWVLGTVAASLAVILVVMLAILALDVGAPEESGSGTNASASDSEVSAEGSADQGGSPDTGASPDEHPSAPEPPVPGAFPGAGGPRPDGAEPLPTYVSRYGNTLSAHLVTPTERIGCDFYDEDIVSDQGLCAITSYNTPDSPLGCIERAHSCKGRWVFPLADDRVQDPTDSSGTTGWMNQPSNDGYNVPVAEYGKQYYFENWVCASEVTGLTCWNTVTGSGVFLSQELTERFHGEGAPAAAPRGETRDAGGPVVLGSMPSNGRGYGTERPKDVYNGGRGTARVTDITWSEWGGERAEGTGTGVWIPSGEGPGRAEDVTATIVAWDLGQCDGKSAYRMVTWYFPSKGQDFNSMSHMDACWTGR